MATCLIGLGSNLGDRAEQLQLALNRLQNAAQIELRRVSPFHATRPAGGPQGQNDFLNAAAVLETSLDPHALLEVLQGIENELGRVRSQRWGQRTLDLDLLLYERLEVSTPSLEIPHPRMSFRRFVIEPAAEIAAELVYPINGWTIAQLLANLNRPENYIAIPWANREFLDSLAKTCLVQLVHDGDFRTVLNREWAKEFGEPSPPAQLAVHAALVALVRQRAAKLDRRSWDHAKGWTVSDFWIDDILLLIDQVGRSVQLDVPALEDALIAFRANIVEPKLVVLFSSSGLEHPSVVQNELETIQALRRRPEVGPVLLLRDIDAERFRSEVLAAMQAME